MLPISNPNYVNAQVNQVTTDYLPPVPKEITEDPLLHFAVRMGVSIAGTVSGAALGGLAGNLVCPLFGSVVGAGVGGAIGSFLGEVVGQKYIDHVDSINWGVAIASGVLGGVTCGAGALASGAIVASEGSALKIAIDVAKFISATDRVGMAAFGQRALVNASQGVLYRGIEAGFDPNKNLVDVMSLQSLAADVFLGEVMHGAGHHISLVAKNGYEHLVVSAKAMASQIKDVIEITPVLRASMMGAMLLLDSNDHSPLIIASVVTLPPQVEKALQGLMKKTAGAVARAMDVLKLKLDLCSDEQLIALAKRWDVIKSDGFFDRVNGTWNEILGVQTAVGTFSIDLIRAAKSAENKRIIADGYLEKRAEYWMRNRLISEEDLSVLIAHASETYLTRAWTLDQLSQKNLNALRRGNPAAYALQVENVFQGLMGMLDQTYNYIIDMQGAPIHEYVVQFQSHLSVAHLAELRKKVIQRLKFWEEVPRALTGSELSVEPHVESLPPVSSLEFTGRDKRDREYLQILGKDELFELYQLYFKQFKVVVGEDQGSAIFLEQMMRLTGYELRNRGFIAGTAWTRWQTDHARGIDLVKRMKLRAALPPITGSKAADKLDALTTSDYFAREVVSVLSPVARATGGELPFWWHSLIEHLENIEKGALDDSVPRVVADISSVLGPYRQGEGTVVFSGIWKRLAEIGAGINEVGNCAEPPLRSLNDALQPFINRLLSRRTLPEQQQIIYGHLQEKIDSPRAPIRFLVARIFGAANFRNTPLAQEMDTANILTKMLSDRSGWVRMAALDGFLGIERVSDDAKRGAIAQAGESLFRFPARSTNLEQLAAAIRVQYDRFFGNVPRSRLILPHNE